MGSMVAIGLMSGTSLDGIDAALIETDGEGLSRPIAFRSEPYSDDARDLLRAAAALALTFDRPRASPDIVKAEGLITRSHMLAVRKLLAEAGIGLDAVDVVGFHGQTIAHRPDRGWTWQIGDGQAMASGLGIRVVNDFRSADVAAGGQGAPLLPVYHRALVANVGAPVAILNLGGVGNITYAHPDTLIAFDTGPANALIDDWVSARLGLRYDEGGAVAASGRVHEDVLEAMLDHPFFAAPPPKSLDRGDFSMERAAHLSTADGAATLTAFTAESVAIALRMLPAPPARLYVAGGGRLNGALLDMIARRGGLVPEPIEALANNGDATEAEGFAYMAVRTLKRLPISFPGTTGVPAPMAGGTVHEPG